MEGGREGLDELVRAFLAYEEEGTQLALGGIGRLNENKPTCLRPVPGFEPVHLVSVRGVRRALRAEATVVN